MAYDYTYIKRYLIKEQGFDEDAVRSFSKQELRELWDEYHDW